MMTGTNFNAELGYFLRDPGVENYGYAERLATINQVLREAQDELIRTGSRYATYKTTIPLTAGQDYETMPDGTGADPKFWAYKDQGAYIEGKTTPLYLGDSRMRIDYQDTSAGIPSYCWFEPDTTLQKTNMIFDRLLSAGLTLVLEYYRSAPEWVLAGKNPTVDVDALAIITANNTPYEGRFDDALKMRACSIMIKRNGFDARQDFEPWSREDFYNALSVSQDQNYTPLITRPMHGWRH